ncbi:MAG: helix-turn-helix transcriptional regulator [Vampirovibrionales bacterium]|nr:helix-turn-helix transcriptional regulator [Vampirovibrionales bacterium]
MPSLGNRLKELRGTFSFYEIGKAIGMTHGNLSKYEQGKVLPSRSTLKKLADYFEVSYQELFQLYLEDTYTDQAERQYIKEWANKI